MDRRWKYSAAESSRRDKKHEREEDLFGGDFGKEFRLPINHRPTENVNLDNVEQASEDRQMSSSNIGFKLLQKMGWRGKGLGKDEQGTCSPVRCSFSCINCVCVFESISAYFLWSWGAAFQFDNLSYVTYVRVMTLES
ncbi:hypothetical protein SOVF_205570 isoform B [Spinacia oleracea]|nr:hypothetical protein SOVF_205570 isoform B [Spinacia oleracea]